MHRAFIDGEMRLICGTHPDKSSRCDSALQLPARRGRSNAKARAGGNATLATMQLAPIRPHETGWISTAPSPGGGSNPGFLGESRRCSSAMRFSAEAEIAAHLTFEGLSAILCRHSALQIPAFPRPGSSPLACSRSHGPRNDGSSRPVFSSFRAQRAQQRP